MLNLLATPFLLLGSASLWIAGLITGNMYVLMEISPDEDNNDDR